MEIHWSLVIFAVCALWGAGTYSVSVVVSEWLGFAKQTRAASMVISAAALIVGAIASMTHLGHIELIFGVLSNPTSGIFIEGLSAALLVLIIAVYLVAILRRAKQSTVKAISTIGIIPALILTFAVGSSYMMVARPAWDNIALPVVSVGTAFLLGALTVFALNAIQKDAGADTAVQVSSVAVLKKVTFIALVVQIVVIIAYFAAVSIDRKSVV